MSVPFLPRTADRHASEDLVADIRAQMAADNLDLANVPRTLDADRADRRD